MRILIILVLSGTLGVLGCETESTGNGGSGGDGSGGSAGSGSGGSGGSAGSGTGGSGGAAGMGGEGGSGGAGLPSAADFCTDFEATCSYGSPNYDDRDDCLADYDAFAADDGRQQCVVEHLGLAEGSTGATRALHCGHTSGLSPCN